MASQYNSVQQRPNNYANNIYLVGNNSNINTMNSNGYSNGYWKIIKPNITSFQYKPMNTMHNVGQINMNNIGYKWLKLVVNYVLHCTLIWTILGPSGIQRICMWQICAD